jgi:ABC-2 type transport system permease protein
MIATLIRLGLINLRRDRVAQALTFILPILFFSIFAMVFGNQRSPTRRIAVAVVDEDRSPYSRNLVAALAAEGGLDVRTTADGASTPLTRAQAEAMVKGGDLPVAVVLPAGLGAHPIVFGDDSANRPQIDLLADVSDPVAPPLVQGLLEKVSFTAAPKSLAAEGMRLFERYSGPLTPAQQASFDAWQSDRGTAPGTATATIGVPVRLINVLQPDRTDASTITFQAAGIGVMFLLFSCAGAGGALLEEQESGTLGRLIGSRAGLGGVLAGKWLYLTLVGALQLCVMFTWGALVFGLPLRPHLLGFLIMTIFTAAAAAAFGVLLATMCRSRAQLSGVSTIVILTMSALGGSMFPRFLMSETMQRVGLVTFNAWALDGYLKVLWRQSPIAGLWPQVSVLVVLTGAFLAAARLFARKWDVA